jgi:hypothetical protein
MNTILLFEDSPEVGAKVEKAIRKNLKTNFKLVRFKAIKKETEKAYDDRVLNDLSALEYKDTVLIVSDRDLSRTDHYRGLSEAVISKAASKLAIPIALYASGYTDNLLARQKQFGDVRIVLDIDSIGEQVASLAEGFVDLGKRLESLLKKASDFNSPASVMAAVLGKPRLTDRISLYGAGDQKVIAEILPFVAERKRKQLEKRLPCILGYWLYDSILRFPGTLVNQVAAASYLNIDEKLFCEEKQIRSLFNGAQYDGPFSDKSNPLWWRDDLDDIIEESGSADGRAYSEAKLKRKVAHCKCSVDPKLVAGYYCMATKRPVSAENSIGNIGWFPPGANLARIRKDIFEEIGPWLGLF